MLRATDESPRLFANELLDRLSRTHWIVVPLLWLPVSALMLVYGVWVAHAGIVAPLGFAAFGFVFWTLVEYWLHRTFFHWTPGGTWGARMHLLVHGVHHDWPHDKYRLVMPPAVSVSLCFLLLVPFYAVFGSRWVWSWYGGFGMGYVFYDCCHYWLHHSNPKTAYFARLKKNHMLHHFDDDGSRFGVSTMIWDRVFGTVGARTFTSRR